MNVTPSVIRALQAVERGEVVNVFTASGNVFQVPKGISARVCRELQRVRWIEDIPGQPHGVFAARLTQRLTAAGRTTLETSK